MATLKAKNNAGEWVDIASATNVTIEGESSTPGLYIDSIRSIKLADGTVAYDLTKYQNCNRFIIIYSAKSTTSSNSYYYRYAYDSANVDGRLKKLIDGPLDTYGSGVTTLVTGNGESGAQYGIFEDDSSAGNSFTSGTVSYPDADIANCIFTHKNHTLSKAIVIYAM